MKIAVVTLVALLMLPEVALAQDTTTVSLMHGRTDADNTEMLDIVFGQFNAENEDGIIVKPTAEEELLAWVEAMMLHDDEGRVM